MGLFNVIYVFYPSFIHMNEQDGNMELSAVHEEKDLGVYFTSDLKPSTQCIKAAAN